MKYVLAMTAAIAFLSGCGSGQPDIAEAFPELEVDYMEVRLGNMPELGEAECNRNMYAGHRSDSGESIKLTLDLRVRPDGMPTQRYERELLLETTSRDDLVVGQVSLFPDTIDHSCREVDVTMLTLRCSYGPHEEERTCPGRIRWQWLQGFKMIKPPTAN